jgi:hypothetical protein
MKMSEIVLHLEQMFDAVGNAELSNKMVAYTTDKKILSKPFTVLVVLVSLWTANDVESFMFVLRH